MAIFIINQGVAQNQSEKDGKQTMKIKVIKEKDGTTTVIDTVITSHEPMGRNEIKELINNLKEDMKELEVGMKNMDMDITMKLSDSIEVDSLRKKIEKVIVMSNNCRNGSFNYHCSPQEYKYNFDVETDLPECQDMWQNFDDEQCDMRLPGTQHKVFRFDDDASGSLNDLLGNIPMERVKSYSIKDHKNGKRIVIDIDDRQTFNSRGNTIIIRGGGKPAGMHYRKVNPDRDVKVIIKTDKDDEKQTAPTPKI